MNSSSLAQFVTALGMAAVVALSTAGAAGAEGAGHRQR